MPYLQVDLDAKKLFHPCALAAGVPVGTIAFGLLELWEYSWASGTAVVGEMVLDGCFGPGERLRAALVAFQFLEAVDGGWRVRGAARYLRLAEARRKGGQKAAKNLKQNRLSSGSSSAPAGDQPAKTLRLPPALTPNTNHLTPNKYIAGKSPPAKPEEPESPGWKELAAGLFGEFKASRGAEPKPRPKDWAALKRLRTRVAEQDEEILRRWRLGLGAQFKQRVDSFFDLDERWDALACAAEATSTPAPVHRPKALSSEELRALYPEVVSQ